MALKGLTDFMSSINNDGILKSNKHLVTLSFNSIGVNTAQHYMASRNYSGVDINKEKDLFSLRCDAVQLPGVYLASADGPPRLGYGPMERRPYGVNFEDLVLTFLVDAKSRVHRMMYDWVNCIVNFQAKGGNDLSTRSSPAGGHAAYEVGYHDNYAATIDITVYQQGSTVDGEKLKAMKLTCYNAFPMAFPSTAMNWEVHEPIRINIPFAYTDYSIKYPPFK